MGLINLDACVVIYAFERHPRFGERVSAAMRAEDGKRFAVSPLVKLECLVGPIRDANLALQRYYEEGLASFVQLPMPEDVFIQAAELRGRSGLRTADALHVAAAQHHACDALWTNDERLAKVSRGLAVNVCG